MFTGIIDHSALILQCEHFDNHMRVAIQSEYTDLIPGESIAVNGCCLTVVSPTENIFYCDISSETMACTTASEWIVGSHLNLERAMRLHDRFGGHIVLGHVDDLATVVAISHEGDFTALKFQVANPENLSLLVHKGSVCVNGVSLTINAVTDTGFECMLIPFTLRKTNLQFLEVHSRVNIEYDYIARIVQRLGEPHANAIFKR